MDVLSNRWYIFVKNALKMYEWYIFVKKTLKMYGFYYFHQNEGFIISFSLTLSFIRRVLIFIQFIIIFVYLNKIRCEKILMQWIFAAKSMCLLFCCYQNILHVDIKVRPHYLLFSSYSIYFCIAEYNEIERYDC